MIILYIDYINLRYLLCYIEETKNGANSIHDGMVLVRLYTNVTVGKYFARMGHVSLRRRESNFQSGFGAVER